MSGTAPLTDNTFAPLFDRLGPFEAAPALAVAVSGGADSLALALLAASWTKGRGGSLLALTVDHRLRPESTKEAEQVAAWLAAHGIAHRILPWMDKKPTTGIQEAARLARYRLLEEACRCEGILHLLVAHHQADQAETVLMRLGRGSGVDGLAAIAPIVELPHVRLLRPLLEVDPAALRATLAARGQDWVEDPSNSNTSYRRVRLRKLRPALAEEGLDQARLAATATAQSRARVALEGVTARLLAECAALDPRGFAILDPEPLLAAPEELALRALSALARTIGGGDPPRLTRLERLLADLAEQLVRRSFAGCLFIPQKRGGKGSWLICREPAALAPAIPAEAGDELRWDGRFRIRIEGSGVGSVGALGPDGLAAVKAAGVESDLPATVAYSLPALRNQSGLCAVPGLGYKAKVTGVVMSIEPAPARPLAGWPGGLVPPVDGIISSRTASSDMCAGNVHSVGAG